MMSSVSSSHNLASNAVSAPTGVPNYDAKNTGSSKPMNLTKNGILQISEAPIQKFQKNQSFVLQIIYNKVFDTAQQKATRKANDEANDAKSKPKLIIASKLALSDGVSQIKAMIPEQHFNKLVNKPKMHDVIEITAFQRLQVNGQDLLMLKDPINVLYDDIDATIGAPKDFKEMKDKYKSLIEQKKDLSEINVQESEELGRTFAIPQGEQSLPVIDESIEPESPKMVAPVEKKPEPVQQVATPKEIVPEEKPMQVQQPVQKPVANKRVSDPFGTSEPAVPTNTTANNFTPIKALSTFCRDWIICARVASKSELRNTKAGGKLLKLELVDKHNTHIEATFFNESAVTFFPQIEENRVYLFSNGYVKMANKKFTSVRNDYSITFDTRSLIEPASDDGAISRHSFDFMPIDQMKEVFQKKTLDVVGIVINVEEKESIKLKSGDQKARKFLEIVDDSMASIGVTCWGDNLCDQQYNLKVGDLLAIKSARLSDFNGKSLNVSDDQSKLFTEVDNDVARRVQKWYVRLTADARSEGLSVMQKLQDIEHLTVRQQRNDNGQGGAGGQDRKQFFSSLICEIEENFRMENDVDNRHIFTLNGYVSRIKNQDKIFYLACPNDNCRKKVMEEAGGYKCDNCSKIYPTCKATYMISAKISDFTDSLYINFAREQGEAIIGMPAEAFKTKSENMTSEELQEFFDSLMFRPFNIMIRGRMESYMGEQRVRYFAIKVLPREGPKSRQFLQNESKSLLERLNIYKDMPTKENRNEMDEQMDDGGMKPFRFNNDQSHGGYM